MQEKKFNLSNNPILYGIIFIVGLIVVIINRINLGFSSILWICDLGSIFGILQVIYLAKHSYLGYVFNIIASSIIGITSLIQHVWLNAVICLLINVPSMIMGLINWLKNEKTDETKNLKTMPKKSLLAWTGATIVIIAIFTVILWLLKGNLFYLDAGFSALCMVGVILTSKMYIEQYYFFLPSNIIGIIMYVILSLQNPNNIPYILTNVVYLIVNLLGLANWTRIKKQQSNKI